MVNVKLSIVNDPHFGYLSFSHHHFLSGYLSGLLADFLISNFVFSKFYFHSTNIRVNFCRNKPYYFSYASLHHKPPQNSGLKINNLLFSNLQFEEDWRERPLLHAHPWNTQSKAGE